MRPPNSPAAGQYRGYDRLHASFCVVLDNKHGISNVAEVAQQLNQPFIIAWMKTDRGLVQNIKRADEKTRDS